MDIVTQREINGSTALAVPRTEAEMLARTREALSIGLFPDKMTPQQQVGIAKVALVYGLDPLMGEIIPYQGKPYITIDGRRRLDARAGHHPSIKFRPLTTEEREFYRESDAISDGDLAIICILKTEHGNEVEGFGRVLARERQGNAYTPVVSRSLEMAQKRAEYRARRMAYGPVAMPAGLEPLLTPIEGDVVEGQVVDITGARELPDEMPATAPAQTPDDDAPLPLEHRLVEMLMAAGLDWPEFRQRKLGGSKTWADWVKLNRGDEQAAYDKAAALLPRQG